MEYSVSGNTWFRLFYAQKEKFNGMRQISNSWQVLLPTELVIKGRTVHVMLSTSVLLCIILTIYWELLDFYTCFLSLQSYTAFERIASSNPTDMILVKMQTPNYCVTTFYTFPYNVGTPVNVHVLIESSASCATTSVTSCFPKISPGNVAWSLEVLFIRKFTNHYINTTSRFFTKSSRQL